MPIYFLLYPQVKFTTGFLGSLSRVGVKCFFRDIGTVFRCLFSCTIDLKAVARIVTMAVCMLKE